MESASIICGNECDVESSRAGPGRQAELGTGDGQKKEMKRINHGENMLCAAVRVATYQQIRFSKACSHHPLVKNLPECLFGCITQSDDH